MNIKRKMTLDMILNIIAVSVPIIVLQLVIYPLSAEILGAEKYGLMLTIYSVWIMVSNSLGNVLNNIRLIHNEKYEEEGIKGDFTILLKRWSIINIIVVFVAIIVYYRSFSILHLILGTIVAFLIMLKAYLEVDFRIKLNYKSIVCNNFLQAIGFSIGCFLLVCTRIWEFIFILGYLFSCIFCIVKTDLLKEERKKTKYYKNVNKDSNELIIASLIGNMMNYADKLVLYPLMGGHAVAIYYTATILGKIVGMLTSPINSVILSYISKFGASYKNTMYKALAAGTGVVVIGYICTMIVGKPVMGVLFPQWVDDVMKYMPITTITVGIMTIIAIIQPFVLKFCEMKWQILIMSCGSGMYFISAIVLWKFFGLMGFCVGTVIGALVKLIIMLTVYKVNTN